MSAKKLLAVMVPFVAGIAGVELGAQEPAISWEAAAGGKMAFEVASIKPSKVPKMPSFPLNTGDAKPPGGRFSANFPLFAYIYFAYKLSPSEGNSVVAQLPKSVTTDNFEIEARGQVIPPRTRYA